MKIIQLIQKPQRRGAEIFAAQLSEQLRLSGNEVLLVSIFEGNAELPFQGEWIKLNRPIANRFFDFKGWRDFSKIAGEFRPDIVQANAADTLKFSVFSKRIFGWEAPIVYRNANQMGDFIRNRFHRIFNQWLLEQVSGIVSVSVASEKDLHSTFQTGEMTSIVIPIGINPHEIELGLKEKAKTALPRNFLLQVGGLVNEKDPLGMLDIFSSISKNHPDLKLIFLGSGSLESALLAKILELGLEDEVQLIPSQQNIFPILAKAKALVMPSKIEGLPGVILESMFCKVPVIAYNAGGISEVLKTAKTGWCITQGKSNDFAVGIKEILTLNSNQMKQILEAAHQLVSAEYSMDKITSRFAGFYRRLSENLKAQP